MTTQRLVLSVLILTLAAWSVGFLNLSHSPAFAQSEKSSNCAVPSPEWDQAIEVTKLLKKASAVNSDVKRHLLDVFSTLQEERNSYVNGTAPVCSELSDIENRTQAHNMDAAEYEKQVVAHNNEVNQYESQCSDVSTVEEQQRCQAWADELNTRKTVLDDWAATIASRKNLLDEEASALNKKVAEINADWESRVYKFIADVNVAMTSLTPAAGELVKILNGAAEKINPEKAIDPSGRHLNCSQFFREVGKLLGATKPEWANQNLEANDVYDEITRNESGEWRKLTGSDSEIQEQANAGVVIIGVTQDRRQGEHGHIAIVSPAPPGLDLKKFGGRGPMIRDGNIYEDKNTGRKHPKDWGTVRASKAFLYEGNPPQWYVWTPSLK